MNILRAVRHPARFRWVIGTGEERVVEGKLVFRSFFQERDATPIAVALFRTLIATNESTYGRASR